MGAHSKRKKHQVRVAPRRWLTRNRPRTARRGWLARVAIGAGAVVVAGGAAVALTLIFGRPRVTVSSSSQALIHVHLSGLGTELTGVQASSAGRSLVLLRQDGGLVPAARLGQGQAVQVTASAITPSWLRWLLGSGVSTAKTLWTPAAAPSATVALASNPGQVPVLFDNPVSVVDYRSTGGPSHVVRLAQPATVADLTVSSEVAAGSLQVAAAPLPWETVASRPSTVTWFVAPPGIGPLALADPAPGSATAASNGPITLTFAEPVASVLGSTRPTISPAVAGAWSKPGPDTLVFTPSGFGFGPNTAVTVGFDRPVSVVGTATTVTTIAAETAYHFNVAPGSVLRLEQVLAQLHYLPLQFTPAAGAAEPTSFASEVASMSEPLAGSFSWRWASTPSALQAEWSVGSSNVLIKGALMSFDSVRNAYDGYELDGETVGQMANASTWSALLQAAVANQVDPNPYSYVYVTEHLPETLTLWQNGSVVLSSAANTGISQDPTATGTYPIYVRYTVNYMSGTDPDGTTYHDLVHWINYFNGSDAVHGFVRGSYGYPQSLGCVELPVSTSETVFSHLAVGDIVTVAG